MICDGSLLMLLRSWKAVTVGALPSQCNITGTAMIHRDEKHNELYVYTRLNYAHTHTRVKLLIQKGH